jgi:hypothetical protein
MTNKQEAKMNKYLTDGYIHGASVNTDLVMIKKTYYLKHVVRISSDGIAR